VFVSFQTKNMDEIILLRKKTNTTLEELGTAVGLSSKTISHYEHGRISPKLIVVENMLRYLINKMNDYV